MLVFVINATDGAGTQFPIILQIPTQSGEADPRWGTLPGMLSFRGGAAAVIASPAQSRGMVMCTGVDVDGGLWPAAEIDALFAQFSRNGDGSYGALALNQSGSGQTFPDTVVSVQSGPFTWQLGTIA